MSRRLTAFALLFALALAAFAGRLWDLQGVHGAEYAQTARRSIAWTETVPAARGRLLDRKGRVLAEDRAVWTLRVSPRAGEETLARLRALCPDWDGEGDVASVSPALLAEIRGEGLEGVTFLPAPQRRDSGALAPHLLGRVGKMSPAEWAVYREKGYALDALVGKDGAEAAFEDLLHGVPGQKVLETDRAGAVTRETDSLLPQPGTDVTLTLDRDLQRAARTALADYLDAHPAAGGGAAAVLDVADGGVLALVSLPDYDPGQVSARYDDLAADPAHPLLNRAIQGLYAPGSVFKLVTAAAALEEGVIEPDTEILDTGKYTYYKSPQPQCWLYRQEGRTHGRETVDRALADSCNVFFYDAGRRVGIDALDRYARAFGLGEKTGIELAGEETGVVAGPDYAEEAGLPWYEGSVLSAAIGQENNRFTPLQLAHLTATLVGDGTRWRVHLLQEGDGPYVPEALGNLTLAPENLAAIKKGMGEVVQEGALSAAFADLPVDAGAKTGSAQVAGAREANGVLVAFAPLEKPEVALAIVVEQGGSGAALGGIAADILRAWARGR